MLLATMLLLLSAKAWALLHAASCAEIFVGRHAASFTAIFVGQVALGGGVGQKNGRGGLIALVLFAVCLHARVPRSVVCVGSHVWQPTWALRHDVWVVVVRSICCCLCVPW
jgi:hypothetical protein